MTTEGLNQNDVKQFNDLLVKANTEQLRAMMTSLQGENAKRKLRGEVAE